MDNPLLQKWTTPFGTPPFHLVETTHFKPAVEEAIKSAAEEIKIISENNLPPDFENTIASLDRAGETLGRITSLLSISTVLKPINLFRELLWKYHRFLRDFQMISRSTKNYSLG